MRCRDAKQWLGTQRDSDLASSDASALQEHLKCCAACRAFEQQQRHIEALLSQSAPSVPVNVSTDHIMRAIQQQTRITQQLEELRQQQQTRIERMRGVGVGVAAISFFMLGSIPLLVLAITIIQTDLVVKALSLLNGAIDTLIILAQYLGAGLALVTRNNLLLSGVAFAFVVMMGMWLRLMRHPQEA